MKQRFYKILCIFTVLILLTGCNSKTNNSSNKEESKIVTCMTTYTDEESKVYNEHDIDILETKNNKIISITHVVVVEESLDNIENQYYYIKGELSEFGKVDGVDINVIKNDNNITFIVKEDLLKEDFARAKEVLKDNDIFTFDDVNSNTTIDEYLDMYKDDYTVCSKE